jgi:glyoxylase-like metal-dependent hydrolase (beta-lactamase superfamily II)
MRIIPIQTGFFKLDGGAMFGVVPKSIWNKLNPADENNLCTWALRCLLVETGNSVLLIDTGIGDKQDARFFSHYHLHGDMSLRSALQAAGHSVETITDVIHTHLHFDHCGGGIRRNGVGFEAVFPNARYWVNPDQWKWAIEPNAREKASFLKENLLPMQDLGLLSFLPTNGSSPWEGVRFFTAYGHTEAMILPIMDHPTGTAVFCADLFPSVHHIPMPYIMGYDMRPLETLSDKSRFFNQALQENWTLIFEHDPVHECARLEMGEKGVRVGATFPWKSQAPDDVR